MLVVQKTHSTMSDAQLDTFPVSELQHRVILPVKAVGIPDVSAMPEKQHCLQMSDQPINRAISAQLEGEEDLTCQPPHSVIH